MLDCFYRALLHNENLDYVARREKELLKDRYDRTKALVDEDLAYARQIEAALKCDPESNAYKLAKAFLEDAENKEAQKLEAVRRYEQIRQEAEETYLQRLNNKNAQEG